MWESMDSSLVLWGCLALGVFWCVGVHNRLMRIRARGLSALGSVEKHMRIYTDLVRESLADAAHAERSTADPAYDDWMALLTALQVFEDALKNTQAGGLRNEGLAHLGQSFDAVQIAWRRLNEIPPDLAGPLVPVAIRTQWDTVTQRVETARGGFNQILNQYNEAIAQFPARLVAGVLGFKPGGTI